ncbi:MAG: putative membrane protein [Gammaproteobacteria bacterium]|jgi:uncharacterized membrane protein
MDLDLIFVLGCIITVFAIPAIVSAFSDNRTPRYPALIILIGVVMVGYAINGRPGAFTFETLPDVFMRVVGRYIG